MVDVAMPKERRDNTTGHGVSVRACQDQARDVDDAAGRGIIRIGEVED